MSEQQEGVYILSAVRTPIGILNGGLSSLPAHELGSIVISEALRRAGISHGHVSDVFMGQILTAGMKITLLLFSQVLFLFATTTLIVIQL